MFVLSALRGPAPTPRNMGVSREGQGEFSLQLEKAMREGDMLRKKIKELLKELRQEKRQKWQDTSGKIESLVTQCFPTSEEEKNQLKEEIKEYEKDWRFEHKITEAKGEADLDTHHKAIVKYLKENVLEPGWSILELGCAAGGVLNAVRKEYENDPKLSLLPRGNFAGVELVTGWVNFAKEHFKGDIKFVEGDVTVDPGLGQTFDFIMLNDVAGHIQKDRYGCFFKTLRGLTHKGSVVYMHTPTPRAQIVDDGQYVENVLPHHLVVTGMALEGFELVTFEHDMDTECGSSKSSILPRALDDAKCYMGGWAKYYHGVFVKSDDDKVFELS